MRLRRRPYREVATSREVTYVEEKGKSAAATDIAGTTRLRPNGSRRRPRPSALATQGVLIVAAATDVCSGQPQRRYRASVPHVPEPDY